MVLIEEFTTSSGQSAVILCCGARISVYDTLTYVLERFVACMFIKLSLLVRMYVHSICFFVTAVCHGMCLLLQLYVC